MPRAWNSLCWPKDQGGLGFRLFSDYNSDLVTKLGWQMCNHREKLWVRVLWAKYCNDDAVSPQRTMGGSSWLWQGIQRTISVLEKGLCFKVGRRSEVHCWKDPWVMGLEEFKPVPKDLVDRRYVELKVADLWNRESLEWNEELIRDCCNEASAEAILHISISQVNEIDTAQWLLSSDKKFLVKNASLEISRARIPLVGILAGEEWKCCGILKFLIV